MDTTQSREDWQRRNALIHLAQPSVRMRALQRQIRTIRLPEGKLPNRQPTEQPIQIRDRP